MKPIRIALYLALLGLLVSPVSGSALTVGNTSKNGSLLVFPLVDGTVGTDTVIYLTNVYYYEVMVACYYRSSSDEVSGGIIKLPADDMIWFSLTKGVSSPISIDGKGEMKCWAVDPSGSQQISWNYLQGFAQITDGGSSWGYPSWNFAANQVRGQPVGEAGRIELSGLAGAYDAMPGSLSFSVPGAVTVATQALVLGKDDLRQDRENIYSKAKFRFKLNKGTTSGTQCIKDQLHTSIDKRMMRNIKVQGIASTVCDKEFGIPARTTQNSPLIGVIKVRLNSYVFAIMPNGVGADGSGYILWDADDSGVEENTRR